jgi:hypothetical protein
MHGLPIRANGFEAPRCERRLTLAEARAIDCMLASLANYFIRPQLSLRRYADRHLTGILQ